MEKSLLIDEFLRLESGIYVYRYSGGYNAVNDFEPDGR